MPPELVQILTQVPIVGVFIWFVLEWTKRNQAAQDIRDKQWRDFLVEQREQNKSVLRELIERIEKIDYALTGHDQKMDQAITTMHERTRTRKDVNRE